jgi:hypothetical protein
VAQTYLSVQVKEFIFVGYLNLFSFPVSLIFSYSPSY